MGSISTTTTSRTNSASEDQMEGLLLTRSPDLLLVMNTPKGRGVFASRDIPARTVLEVSPVLVLDPYENEHHIRKTNLYNYTYNWPYTAPSSNGNAKTPNTTQAVILGLGSMFNHSTLHQNVGWERDIQNLLITYRTLRDIKAGEELCISYGDSGRLTFKDADIVVDTPSDEDWEDELLKTGIIDLID